MFASNATAATTPSELTAILQRSYHNITSLADADARKVRQWAWMAVVVTVFGFVFFCNGDFFPILCVLIWCIPWLACVVGYGMACGCWPLFSFGAVAVALDLE